MNRSRIAPLILAAWSATASAAAPVEVDVRMMNDQEIVQRYDVDSARHDRAAGFFVGSATLLVGAATPASTVIVLGPPAAFDVQPYFETVRQALYEARYTELLAQALAERVKALAPDAAARQMLSVEVAFYGLQARDGRPSVLSADLDFCLVADGYATVLRDGWQPHPQRFSRGVNNLSPGMGAPACDDFSVFGQHGGLPVRQAARESANAVADWLITNVVAPP